MPKIVDPFDSPSYIRTFPDSALRDMGRNEACPREYRKLAVEVLLHRKSPYANHTDLQEFVTELKAELEGIPTEFPDPEYACPVLTSETTTGPLRASVTTSSLYGVEVVKSSEESNLTIPDDSLTIPPSKKDTDATQ